MAKPLIEAGPDEIGAFQRRMHRDVSLGRITKDECAALEPHISQIIHILHNMKERYGHHTQAQEDPQVG